MDISSLIGIIIGCASLFMLAYEASHGDFMMFFSMEGVFAVFGGSISVVFMAMPLRSVLGAMGYTKRFLFHRAPDPVEVIKTIVSFSEKARRDGILALEGDVKNAKDPFLGAALRMAIDGIDASSIEATMRLEILAMQERHKAGKKFFDLIKVYGPGWGLVATLLGQVGMFANMGGSVADMGKMLALAVTATMYGTLLANGVAGPMGDKLGLRSSEEILARELILQGVLSLQAGDNPRVTMDRLTAFIPNAQRVKLKAA